MVVAWQAVSHRIRAPAAPWTRRQVLRAETWAAGPPVARWAVHPARIVNLPDVGTLLGSMAGRFHYHAGRFASYGITKT